jgi:biuret amidohydrolase
MNGAGMARIDAAPFAYELPPERTALVVIDMQRDFLEPGGFGAALGNDVSRLRAILPATRRLLDGCRAAGITVLHTRECHAPDLSDCPPAKRERGAPSLRIGDRGPMGRVLIRGEPGAEIVPELAPLPGEAVVDKPGKGAFHATPLGGLLADAGITHLLIAGVTTEVCVQTTMREANDRGFECLVLSDCVGSYFPAFHEAGLQMIAAQGGIFGWVAASPELLAALAAVGAPTPTPITT